MALVALLDPQLEVTVHRGVLRFQKGRHVVREVPPHEVSEVQIHCNARVHPAARKLLLRAGIDLAFFTVDGRYLGRLLGPGSRAGDRRLAQYAFATDPVRALALARQVVAGKIENQRRLLLGRQRRVRSEAVADALAALRTLGPALADARDLDALRGVEGYAAQRYFGVFGELIQNPLFTFTGRNRRPPRDPINACLSYGYALLVSEVERGAWAAGLEPWIGCLHAAARGAPALVLDLAEEWRPLVDDLVLTLANRRQISPEDFRTPPAEELGAEAEIAEDAIYLGRVGREVLVRAWSRTLDRRWPHPETGDRWRMTDLVREQGHQVARLFEGRQDTYHPVRLGG